jgi:hypothetical protein
LQVTYTEGTFFLWEQVVGVPQVVRLDSIVLGQYESDVSVYYLYVNPENPDFEMDEEMVCFFGFLEKCVFNIQADILGMCADARISRSVARARGNHKK